MRASLQIPPHISSRQICIINSMASRQMRAQLLHGLFLLTHLTLPSSQPEASAFLINGSLLFRAIGSCDTLTARCSHLRESSPRQLTGDHLCFGWKTSRMSWLEGMKCSNVLALQTESAFLLPALRHAVALIHSALPENLLRTLDAHDPHWLQAALCPQRLQGAQGLPACPGRAHWRAGLRTGCGRALRQRALRSGHLAPRWRGALRWDRPLPCPYLCWTSPICPAPAAEIYYSQPKGDHLCTLSVSENQRYSNTVTARGACSAGMLTSIDSRWPQGDRQ